jgi:divalent metal cation (Fe/Co/Zn/Cd) transporter
VTAFVARVAWTNLAPSVHVLTDHVVIDPAELSRVVAAVPGVVGCHRVRSRGADGAVAVDLHIHVDGELSLYEAHEIADAVEAAIGAAFPAVGDVHVHVEPATHIDRETPLPG